MTDPKLTSHPLSLFDESKQATHYVALKIAEVIRQKQLEGKPAVLGLATGNTPRGVYEELIRLHRNEGLSFVNVISFNLDEYFPIHPEDEQSYTYFMNTYLFNHVNINPENVHIPLVPHSEKEIPKYCDIYEEKIRLCGGIDIQLLGIGRNGHIGFNEPGSSFDSTTRLVNLHHVTRNDAVMQFKSLDKVPTQAVSIGIQTIRQAKKVVLLALGGTKSEIIKQAVQGDLTINVPASVLQTFASVEYVLDRDAGSLLSMVEAQPVVGYRQ